MAGGRGGGASVFKGEGSSVKHGVSVRDSEANREGTGLWKAPD